MVAVLHCTFIMKIMPTHHFYTYLTVCPSVTIHYSSQDAGADMLNEHCEQILGGALTSGDDGPATDCI